MTTTYGPGPLTTARRRAQRVAYDAEAVHGVLDSALICHMGFVIDGRAIVLPLFFWREDDAIYVHGAAMGRRVELLSAGAPVTVTVSHLDGLVLTRSAFHHSVNYRSAMVFGRGFAVTDIEEKRHHAALMIERISQGRSAEVRPASDKELNATSILGVRIEEASAKIRNAPGSDDPEDLALPTWAGVVPVLTTLGVPEPDPHCPPGLPSPKISLS